MDRSSFPFVAESRTARDATVNFQSRQDCITEPFGSGFPEEQVAAVSPWNVPETKRAGPYSSPVSFLTSRRNYFLTFAFLARVADP